MSEENLFVLDFDTTTDEKVVKPVYEVDHSLVEDTGECSSDDEEINKPSGDICWNCDKTGHGIRECKEPFNQQKVNQNRKKFMNTKSNNSKRYHDDKFSCFKPGVFSKTLRKALNLRKDEIPKHIYAMRTLGYPPGWLAEARLTTSGINMYNTSGKRIPEPDEEEGEIISKTMKYDIEKIVDYPGFNVPLKQGSRDDHYKHGYPPMRSDQSKESFIKYLEEVSSKEVHLDTQDKNPKRKSNEPNDIDDKRKVRKIQTESNVHTSSSQSSDDGEDAVATCSPPPADRITVSTVDTPADSLAVEEGEITSDDVTTQNPSTTFPDEGLKPDVEPGVSSPVSPDTCVGNGTPICETPSAKTPFQGGTPSSENETGTPHVKTHSPFTKLPSFDKFNKNISDVIDFENLPDSVGKYSTMCSLIEKIRTHMATTKRKSNS